MYGLRGMGSFWCGTQPASWEFWCTPNAPVVAPPGAPTGAVLTVPPASGAEAQATVDALVNQQMLDQQALNAQGVQSSTSDVILGSGGAAVTAASAAASSAFSSPWLWIGVAGVAAFAVVAIGGGSPRRYGR
jgi:hypothetical protein